MPLDFSTRVQIIKTEFENLYKNWSDADTAASTETDTKIIANNTIFNNMKTMLSDAQKVFRKDAVLSERFSLTDLMTQVRGTRPSGLNGKVVNAVNTKTIVNAQIAISSLDKVVTSDANGQFQFGVLPVGKYTIVITAAGYETVTIEKYEIKSSVVHRLIVKMTEVEVAVMA
jgi:hypothetical protein